MARPKSDCFQGFLACVNSCVGNDPAPGGGSIPTVEGTPSSGSGSDGGEGVGGTIQQTACILDCELDLAACIANRFGIGLKDAAEIASRQVQEVKRDPRYAALFSARSPGRRPPR